LSRFKRKRKDILGLESHFDVQTYISQKNSEKFTTNMGTRDWKISSASPVAVRVGTLTTRLARLMLVNVN